MAENENGEEKTEKATSKKRQDARKKGQVLKSQDVSIVCSLFLTFAVLRLTAPLIFTNVEKMLTDYLSEAGGGIGDFSMLDKSVFVHSFMKDMVRTVFLSAGALFLAAMLVTFISTGVQTKFLVSFESMKFNLGKLNPLKGIKKMFSLRGIFELAKSLLKLTVLVAVVYNAVSSRLPEIARLVWVEPKAAVVYIANTVFTIAMTIGGVFVAVAAVDFMFQRHQFENDLMMTKQEVKDEFKQMEGDPKVKGKRRAIQQKMAYSRMMQEVPSADVIIRNPTHFAVAIKYTPGERSAPVVVAKGQDAVALRIVEVGEEADVPAIENRPLARALYDKVELDSEIPEEFYQSVAEVLLFVYNLKNKPVPGADDRMTGSAPFNY